jgi:hypothetical protein
VINDYVAWIVIGLACLGTILGLIMRRPPPGRITVAPWVASTAFHMDEAAKGET